MGAGATTGLTVGSPLQGLWRLTNRRVKPLIHTQLCGGLGNAVMNARMTVAAVLVFFGASGLAGAQEVVLTPAKTTDPVVHHIAGQAIDIDGLTTGLTAEAAKTALSAAKTGFALSSRTASPVVEAGGKSYRLAEAPAALVAYSKATKERVELRFASPVTGSPVVAIRKRLSYAKTGAPTVDSVVSGLLARYGTPSADATKKDARILTWMVPEQGRFVCPANEKRKAPVCPAKVGLGNGAKGNAAKALQAGVRLGIEAVVAHEENGDAVTSVAVTVDDYANRQASDDALQAFVKAEAEKRAAGK